MPIRINLLAEAQDAEELKRRDPVKRGIWVGVFVIFLVGLWASTVMVRVHYAKNSQDMDQQLWDSSLKKKSADVAEVAKKLKDVEKKIESLSNLSTNRFLWGSFLNVLQNNIVDQIQISRIQAEVKYTQFAAMPRNTPPKPAISEESITVTIQGRDYGDRSYEKLKAALLGSSYLSGYLTKAEMIRLQSLEPHAASPAEGGKEFKVFTLVCEFPKTTHHD